MRVPEASFMGTIGVAPSRALRQEILLREDELLRRGGMVVGPTPAGAVPADEPFASEGLRTIPPREHGGNVDIKQLTAGTRLMLPVFTEGALFSAGDAHYAQGDSECCGTAIEMDCTLHVSFRARKGEATSRRSITSPISNATTTSPARRWPLPVASWHPRECASLMALTNQKTARWPHARHCSI